MIPVTDYSGLDKNDTIIRVGQVFDNDLKTAFDLEKGPLYRFYLIKTGEREYFFRLSIHHIVFDGWSWSVLVKELNEIYNSLLNQGMLS